ncbi:MAG: hypothetical protein WCD21_12230 [Streptomyces sp.]
MDITGHSSDFIVDMTFPVAVQQFVARRRQRWPGLFLCGEPVAAASADWELPAADAGDDHPDIVTFSSGQEMEDFWDANGYALDGTGEGPFSVFYRLHAQPLRAGRVTGVQCADHEPAAAAEGTGLLLGSHFSVSLVTPEDPATDPFSGRVLADFLESFGSPSP